jgi:hypothetical protein
MRAPDNFPDVFKVTQKRVGQTPVSSSGFARAILPGGRFRKGGEAPLRVT